MSQHAAPRADAVICARGLTRRFGPKLALEPFDLDVRAGTIAGLVGPNGSGKSTLLRCLLGIVRADAGSAWIGGVALRGDGTDVRRRATYSPGELALYGELRGRDHLDWLTRGREREAATRAVAIAGELGLPLAKRVRGYSHGMKRQLLFAAALAPRVPVRVLDEITEGLDPEKRGAVIERMRADAREGTTILLSSHHLGEIDRVCDRLVFLRDGKKLAEEASEDVARRARRIVHLSFEPEAELSSFERAVRELPGASATRDGAVVALKLDDEDPRAALAALFARRDLPRPRTIRYGELSLAELYRELYGVEAC